MKKIFFFILTVLFFSGCTITTHFFQEGATPKTVVDPAIIKIYSGDIDKEYDVLGSVAVDVAGDGKLAQKHLKIEAGKMGANAVIFAKLTKLSSVGERTGLSGVAVVLK